MRKCQSSLKITMVIVFLLFSLVNFAQSRTVTGIVSDNSGAPLGSATVSVKGSATATVTDANGAFKITVPSPNSVLVVSFVGAKSVEVSTSGKSTVLVTIDVTESKLGEVVVVGYGKSRRSNLTSAQTTVSAKDIARTVNTTIEQAIQGRAAGVYVTQNSGQPGGGISVNIRGVSSLCRPQPLEVVD